MSDHTLKEHPQLLNVKRIASGYEQMSTHNSTSSLQDDPSSLSPPTMARASMNKSASQISLQTSSSTNSLFSSIAKVKD